MRRHIQQHWRSYLLGFLMLINLAYMHYEVFFSNHSYPGFRPYYNPIVFMCFDVLWIVGVFSLLSLRKWKLTYSLSYTLILVIVLANIIYSRFFGQYLTFSALGEVRNFKGGWWLSYFSEALRWSDLILVASTLTAFYIIKKSNIRKVSIANIVAIIFLFGVFHLTIGSIVINYLPLSTYKDIKTYYDENIGGAFNYLFLSDQERIVSHCGIVRTQFMCNLFFGSSQLELSSRDMEEIKRYLANKNTKREGISVLLKDRKDIVFIIVESWLSVTSNLVINGKEITPNLNKLISEPDSYFNPNIISNRGAGESIDAEISYLTGYLPLQKQISVPYILKNECYGIPDLLRKQRGYSTYMTLPSSATFWHQNELNAKIGIENLYALGWTNDSILFTEIIQNQRQLKSPYFHVIVTISMHGTYNDSDLPKSEIVYPFTFPNEYSREYHNYLKKCYYTDYQIGLFFDYLKKSGKYDNTIIIVASDHEAHDFLLKMDKHYLNNLYLPLIIAHTGIIFPDTKESINQIDVYPTLLDLFGLKSKWRGIGNSILRERHEVEITDSTRIIADKILRGNWLGVSKFESNNN